MHKLIAPLAAAGAVLVGATLFIRSRRTDTSEPYEELDVLKDIVSPEAAELLAASKNAAPGDASEGCCQNGAEGGGCCQEEGGGGGGGCCSEGVDEATVEGSGCGCSTVSAASQVVERRDGKGQVKTGVSKDEYRALKKAGQTPHQLAMQRGSERGSIKSGSTGGAPLSQVLPGQRGEMIVLFATQGGASGGLAKDVLEDAWEKGFTASLMDLSADNAVALLAKRLEKAPVPMLVFVTSTWTGGTPPPAAVPFFTWMLDAARPLDLFEGVRFVVYALGNSEYKEHFCTAGRTLDNRIEVLGGKRQVPMAEDDDAGRREVFGKWKDSVWVSQGARLMGNSVQFIDEDSDISSDMSSAEEDDDIEEPAAQSGLTDLEDLGGVFKAGKGEKGAAGGVAILDKPKKMLNDRLAASLTKQGYKLVGSHSGVKLCRWTKAMLRGRGGCYKHTFYGIASYQCMEATPSLACANKCVFCWRHHKNPVGTTWRWETDEPKVLIDGFMSNHRKMIKEMRGLPGVIPERLAEAQTIRHCALSLVGEPIIYPHINKFLQMLHAEGISSFLVTNAQFPAQMESLVSCTQLYVSIDASNETDLKEVDRPLFPDFWNRFLECVDALSRKGQRTVFRLTLVRDWNMNEVQGYADLVKRGLPDFVEVKGVTFTGGNKPELGMKNVPWHAEVLQFTQSIAALVSDEYEVCSEHAHSCAVLMARKSKFKKGNDWYTWIDFPKFLELQAGVGHFTAVDYMAKTPEWAVFGRGDANDGGFDPAEIHYRKGDSRVTTPASTRPATPAV
ncbi:hypothetical protein T484DRAFT_3331391 [Baffinella frigidus]|nr:hypothetical protein T484DRAFT_3331391 [Cryptophyta sp. CCMP2293]|mmetsp:Transcript_23430/g.55971  ORF Transcript_23430/g.55971 Transcript_23430/m.55971 type:complete len:786 (-) Transcript_23430:287-2644(-)